MSAIDSPRPSCSSCGVSAIGVAPSRAAAAANETRVRVDGFSKMQAIDLPAERVLVARRLVLHRLGELEQLARASPESRSEIRVKCSSRLVVVERRHRHHPVTTVSGCAVFACATIGSSTSASVGDADLLELVAHVPDRVP